MKQALLTLISALILASVAAAGTSAAPELTTKQVAKAESLITKLESFDAFVKVGPNFSEYRTRLEGLSPEIYKRASNLQESNAKTDLLTAVRCYELAARVWNKHGSSYESLCAGEKPGAYQRLCQGASGSRRGLLLAKARLHLTWARATLDFHLNRGEDAVMLREIEFERGNDGMLARAAINFLRLLGNDVIIHRSLSDLQENGALAHVPYEAFRDKLGRTSIEVEKLLSWLPQNKLKFEIRNALHSYQDGGLWWGRFYQPRIVRVSKLKSPAADFTVSGAYQDTVPYIVAINWRWAGKSLERAEGILGGNTKQNVRHDRTVQLD
jgi:hypothetical protein